MNLALAHLPAQEDFQANPGEQMDLTGMSFHPDPQDQDIGAWDSSMLGLEGTGIGMPAALAPPSLPLLDPWRGVRTDEDARPATPHLRPDEEADMVDFFFPQAPLVGAGKGFIVAEEEKEEMADLANWLASLSPPHEQVDPHEESSVMEYNLAP